MLATALVIAFRSLSAWCRVDTVLVTQYYDEPCQARMAEMVGSLHANLNNSHIDRIHVLQYDPLPGVLPQGHPKLRAYPTDHPRLTLGEALLHANEHLRSSVVVVANNDVTFDDSLAVLTEDRVVAALAGKYSAFALSRVEPHEHIGIGSQCSRNYIGSHDAFVVHSPVPQSLATSLGAVWLGQVGADARFVYEARRAGLAVGNPCHSITVLHHHRSGHRSGGIRVEANLDGKSALAPPQTIDDFLDNDCESRVGNY